MSEPYGAHEAKLAYIAETSYGQTPPTPAMTEVTAESVEPAINPALIEVRGIGSRDLAFMAKGLRTIDLKFVNPMQNKDLLDLAVSLGSISAEVLYEKTASIISLLHKGCILDKITVECAVEQYAKQSVDCIGQDLTVGVAKVGTTYTPVTTTPITFYDSYVKKATVAIERVTAWKFIIENHLKRVPVIRTTNGQLLKYLMERHRSITGEIEFEFETKEEYEDVVGDVAFALEIGLGGTNKATFTGCKWSKVSTPTRIEDLIALKAPFVAKTITIA